MPARGLSSSLTLPFPPSPQTLAPSLPPFAIPLFLAHSLPHTFTSCFWSFVQNLTCNFFFWVSVSMCTILLVWHEGAIIIYIYVYCVYHLQQTYAHVHMYTYTYTHIRVRWLRAHL